MDLMLLNPAPDPDRPPYNLRKLKAAGAQQFTAAELLESRGPVALDGGLALTTYRHGSRLPSLGPYPRRTYLKD